MPKIEVVLSPALLHLEEIQGKNTVMTDVLRASSTIVAALGSGIESVIPVASVEEARAYQEKGYKIGGERHGKPIEGFDLGNSPIKIQEADLGGKSFVLSTTNGTRCIEMLKESSAVYIGALLNLSSLAEHFKSQEKDLLILCAAWKDHVNFEDLYYAGALVKRLKGDYEIANDGATVSMGLYDQYSGSIETKMEEMQHFKRLSAFGVEDDIRYSMQEDLFDVVPVLQGKHIRGI